MTPVSSEFNTLYPIILVQLFIRFPGASYRRSVNVCSGTVGDMQEGLYGNRLKWENFCNGLRMLAVQ